MHSILTQISILFENFEKSFIQLFLNINDHIIDIIKNFKNKFITLISNYANFYFKHFTQHFFQMKNYSIIEKHSFIKISASSIMNFFSNISQYMNLTKWQNTKSSSKHVETLQTTFSNCEQWMFSNFTIVIISTFSQNRSN